MSITYNGKSVLAIYRNGTAVEQALIAWNWTPRQLYFGGVRGAAYVPDAGDAYGLSNLASFGEGVSAILDEKNGPPVLGTELVTNGGFSSGSSWVLSGSLSAISGESLRLGDISTVATAVQTGRTFTAGKRYSVSFNIVSRVSGTVRIYFGASAVAPTAAVSAVGAHTFIVLMPSNQTEFALQTQNNPADMVIDNVSIKEISGEHALQASISPRPLLGRAPIGGNKNRIIFSDQFNQASWEKTGGTIDANVAIAPNSEMAADKLIENVGTINGAVVRSENFYWFGGAALTAAISIYAKEVAGSAKRYLVFGASTASTRWAYLVVDLATGTVTANRNEGIQTGIVTESISVQPADNGYYRISFVVLSPLAGSSYYLRAGVTNTPTPTFTTFAFPAYTGDGVSGVLLWGAQAELASVVSPYQQVGATTLDTTQPGAESYPFIRMDLSDDTLTTSGLGSTKNLLSYSEEFDNSIWFKEYGNVVQPNVTIAPDGTLTADKLIEKAATHSQRFYRGVPSLTVPRVFSVYMKQAERNWALLEFANGAFAFFNLATGEVGATGGGGITANITPAPNGFYRCEIRYSGTGGIECRIAVTTGNSVFSYLGDGTSGIFLWGAQFEAGSAATAYEYGGFKGSALVSGRNGTTFDNIILPDGSFSLGPTTYTGGTPGLLRAVGDIVGYNILNKTLTAKERKYLIEYYKDRGAKGMLVPGGPELVSSASLWAGSANWSVDTVTGTATVTSASSSGDDLSIGSLTSDIGKHYLALFTIQSVSGGSIRVNGSRVVTGSGLSVAGTYTSVMSITLAGLGSLTLDVSAGGVSSVVSNISVKELRPEEEWT